MCHPRFQALFGLFTPEAGIFFPDSLQILPFAAVAGFSWGIVAALREKRDFSNEYSFIHFEAP